MTTYLSLPYPIVKHTDSAQFGIDQGLLPKCFAQLYKQIRGTGTALTSTCVRTSDVQVLRSTIISFTAFIHDCSAALLQPYPAGVSEKTLFGDMFYFGSQVCRIRVKLLRFLEPHLGCCQVPDPSCTPPFPSLLLLRLLMTHFYHERVRASS